MTSLQVMNMVMGKKTLDRILEVALDYLKQNKICWKADEECVNPGDTVLAHNGDLVTCDKFIEIKYNSDAVAVVFDDWEKMKPIYAAVCDNTAKRILEMLKQTPDVTAFICRHVVDETTTTRPIVRLTFGVATRNPSLLH